MLTIRALAATAAAATTILLAGAPAAQERATQQRSTPRLVLDVGEHDIFELIDRVARHLQRNYLTTEVAGQGLPNMKISLQTPVVLDASNCEDTLTRLAYTCGLVMVPVSPELGIYEWVAMAGPKRGEVGARATEMEPDEVLARRRSRIRVMTALRLEHLDANHVTNSLRPMFMSNNTGGMMVASGINSVMLNGFADEVASAIDLIRKLDVPSVVVAPTVTPPEFVPVDALGAVADPHKHVATHIRLEHLHPQQAAQGLGAMSGRSQPQMPQNVRYDAIPLRVSPLGDGISLIGRAAQVAVAIRQVRAADVPGASQGPKADERFAALDKRLRALEKELAALRGK